MPLKRSGKRSLLKKMGNILEDYGEIESLVPCQYKSKGIKVDAYHYDDEFKDFTLIVSHFWTRTIHQKHGFLMMK